MSICGSTCSVTIDGDNSFEGHRFVITTNAPEIDVRAFSSGNYGSWISCVRDGTITIDTYKLAAGVEAGDTVDIVAVVGDKTLTANDCVCTNVTVNVDAKDVVINSYNFRLSGTISGW